MTPGPLVAGALAGLRFAAAFNPVVALAGSMGAAVVGTMGARRGWRAPWWLAVAALAWLVGDGTGVWAGVAAIGRSGRLPGGGPALWVFAAAWVLGGLALGYVIPAWVGIEVGRRVVFGTGWLAAAAVAATLCLAFLAIGSFALPAPAG